MVGVTISRNKHDIQKQVEEYQMNRKIIRQSWNGGIVKQIKGKTGFTRATPFRLFNYAADPMGRKTGSTLHTDIAKVSNSNPKFVYDNSDYVRFLKQKALLKTYTR